MRIPAIAASLLVMSGLVTGLASTKAGAADPLLFGQDHYYTATIRNDKRVVTTAKLVFENDSDKPQQDFRFSLPDGVTTESMSIYQINPPKKAPGCKTYEALENWKKRITPDSNSSPEDYNTYYQKTRLCLEEDKTLSEYNEDFDFRSIGYINSYAPLQLDSSNISFSRTLPTQNGLAYTVPLPLTIKPGKKGAILVSYVATGMVSEFLGSYTYNYKTLKVADSVNTAAVTINLDQDLYSRDVKARTTTPTAVGSDMGLAAPSTETRSSSSLNQLANIIINGGTISRTGTHLLGGNTFTVSGSFADSPWQLFYREIGIGLAILAIGGVGGWYLWRRNRHDKKKRASTQKDYRLQTLTATKRAKAVSDGKLSAELWMNQPIHPKTVIFTLLASSAGVIALTGLLFIIQSVSGTNSSASLTYGPILTIGSLIGYSYFGLILPLFMTIQYGRKTIFAWVTIQSIVVIIAVIIISSTMIAAQSTAVDPIRPMMDTSSY